MIDMPFTLLILGALSCAGALSDVAGSVQYVSPEPSSRYASGFNVLVDVRLVVTVGGSAFLGQCGGLVGRPQDQARGAMGCKLRLWQLDWSRNLSTAGSSGNVDFAGGMEHADAEAMLVALDSKLCTPPAQDGTSTRRCGLAVSVVLAENGMEVGYYFC